MNEKIAWINEAITRDARAFVRECEARYTREIDNAAQAIAHHMSVDRIVLLAGTSGSGKTTTAKRLGCALAALGIEAKTVSMDDYYNTIEPVCVPRLENGDIDYESPLCLDRALINDHLARLERGETVMVPSFDFARQERRLGKARAMSLGDNEVAIYEGIHALNGAIAGRAQNALTVFVSPDGGESGLHGDLTRLVRRLVRDTKYRGVSASYTMKQWLNVRRGEEKHILPYRQGCDIFINTALEYELAVLGKGALAALATLDESERSAETESMVKTLEAVCSVGEELVPQNSILREFIGAETFAC